jgi:putative membrane-bound dehydrogenase-like protein
MLPRLLFAFAAGALLAQDLPKDTVAHAGLPPEEAVRAATLPPGFAMTVFAAEPDLVNPIAFCLDARGRLWVAEGLTYPNRAPEGEGRDRILVFEDTDGDGRHDRRTVFAEKLNLVSGLEIGYGGLWVGAAPYLMFFPIVEGDAPRPLGEPQILLDGWGYQDTHETLNTFRWGPDGWLYGCHGVFTHSRVGRPGKPEAERKKINAGFWRYHPTRHEFEVFAEGTSNPWGIDFDAHGHLFAEACVIPHLFHVIQGARYHRQAGQHFHPHTYDDLKTIADHRHYLGANPHGGNNKSDAAGGGHAHAGLVIPQHPAFGPWQGRILMGNIHGQRINADLPEKNGSGFLARHGPDFLNFHDRASQVVDLRQGPGGTLYLIDWYDLQQCHRTQREAHEYEKGRLYRVQATPGKIPPVDLTTQSPAQLAALALGDDAWARTTARRLLQERGTTPAEVAAPAGPLRPPEAEPDPTRQLRALWLEHALEATTDGCLLHWLKTAAEPARLWAIRLAAEDHAASPALCAEFARLARENPSPDLALALLSATPRLPLEQRRPILEPLLARADFAEDPNLPLMLWWAVEPLVAADPAAAAELLGQTRLPQLQEYIARRMAASATK